MDRPVDLHALDTSEDALTYPPSGETFEQEFDRLIREDDGSAADEILASGQPIVISRPDTPIDHVIWVHPDGHEELMAVDWEDVRRVLG